MTKAKSAATDMRELTVVYRDPASLTDYENNSRTHSPEQIEKLRASIREFGFTNPILLKNDDTTIGAGHARNMAALAEGLDRVPTITLHGLSDAQWRAYVIADNQLALTGSGWDEDILRTEMEALEALDFDMPLLGFNGDELAALLADKTEGLTDPDDVPEVPADPVSVLGDVWVLGRHRVLCGSSTSADDLDKALAGLTPDIVCSDPPYGINVVKGSTVGGAKPFGKVGGVTAPFGGWKDGDRSKGAARQGRVHGPARNAIIAPGTYAPIIGDDTTDTAVEHYALVAAMDVPAIVLWGGNYFADALPPSRCWLVWDKENTGTFADAELAWTNQDKVVKLLRHQWSGLIKASEKGQKRVHPTQKPAALAEWVIDTIAPSAKVLLDGFLGSGWTLMACEKRGISCVGIELSPAYVDVAVKRWQDFTGKQAVHAETGQPFAQVARERGV